MCSSPTKTPGALWRSQRIHLMDISRSSDNGDIRCDCRRKDDSGVYKLRDSELLRCCRVDVDQQIDGSMERDMSEAVFSPIKSFVNDGSDFSDTSRSFVCSTSPTPLQFDAIDSFNDGVCRECTNPSVHINAPNKRRRRRIVTRSLILDSRLGVFPNTPKKLSSDSGAPFCEDYNVHPASDSSTSSSSNVPPVRRIRRKPKSFTKKVPPSCHYWGNQAVLPMSLYCNGIRPRSWIPSHSEDISSIQKLQELENDKKNLILQASVLADQVEAQADKIAELERLLEQKKDGFIRLEQNLHQEMLAHSAIESSKLELMSELSNLRLRLTAAERDRKESDDKCRKLENELSLLQAGLFEQEADHAALRGKVALNGSHNVSAENYEIEKLRSTLDSLMISDKEKDCKIEDLRSSLSKYKKLQDMFLSIQMRKNVDSGRDPQMIDSENAMSSINSDTLRKLHFDSSSAKAAQTLSAVISTSFIPSEDDHSVRSQCSTTLDKDLSEICSSSAFQKSNSVENICPSSATSLSSKSQYGTMPRQSGAQVLQQLQVRLKEHDTDEKTMSAKEQPEISVSDVAIKGRNKNGRSPSRTSGKNSGVLFAGQECVFIPTTEKENLVIVGDGAPISSEPHLIKTEKDKNRGFLKFFSKWKRCGSQNIEKIEGEFKRGGVRATAGPRLGWSRDIHIDPDIPFSQWNVNMILEWLHKLGLSMYISECKSWMCNGEMLLKASSHDLEKELNIRHPLHKKKLLLAIKCISSTSSDIPQALNNIDYQWVVRWLDDIGLPQYKDAFTEARVDGRVLHFLTMDDLLFLKVTSQLHHISIKCGIQLLREKGFDPHCLVRRSLPDEDKMHTPEMVALWSNHRVMEWLRTVDLSEYAPNLRGSGVHGALIVYETKFNTNLFATLLNIPPTKTLLRRHLATHFKHIVGDELMQIKREKETEAPLSPSVKIKIIRKPQFALKKKRSKSEFENEELICPMDIPVCSEVLKISDCEKLVVRRNSDPSPQEQRHLDLKTMLHDENLSEAPTTVV